MVDKPEIIETQRFEDFRGWLSVSAEGFHVVQINQGFSKKAGTLASPQTWVLAMKNPRILRGLRRFYRNDQDH